MENKKLKEEWKTVGIPGLEDFKVSTYGKVAVKDRESISGRKLKGHMIDSRTVDGRATHLTVNGAYKTFQIGKLVASTFLPKEETDYKQYVIHIDGNLANNRVDNLKWGSGADAYNHGQGRNIIGIKAMRDSKTYKFNSLAECCKKLKLDVSNVSLCLNPKMHNQTHHGYSFEWIKE